MQKVLVEDYPDANLTILIVWLQIYPADTLEVVGEAARLFSGDPRVTQFYDPGNLTALEVAAELGAGSGEVAWDIYLFYAGQDEWVDQLPQPIDWIHQLKGSSWAEPGRLVQGDQLARGLHEIILNLLDSD